MSAWTRRLASFAAGLAAAACLAAPTDATAAAVSAAEPRGDFPFLPRECAAPADLVPQRAMKCEITRHRKGAPTIVLWGDSHSYQLLPAIRRAMSGHRINLVAFIFGSCPVMDPRLTTAAARRAASECDLNGHKALRYIEHSRRQGRDIRVVIGNAWQIYHHLATKGDSPYLGHELVPGADAVAKRALTGTPRAMRHLGRLGVPTDVIGQAPFVPAEPRPCAQGRHPYRCTVPINQSLHRYAAIKSRLRGLMDPLPRGSRLIETRSRFCTAKICRGTIDGIATFADDGHISASIAKTMGSFFEPTVRALLSARR